MEKLDVIESIFKKAADDNLSFRHNKWLKILAHIGTAAIYDILEKNNFDIGHGEGMVRIRRANTDSYEDNDSSDEDIFEECSDGSEEIENDEESISIIKKVSEIQNDSEYSSHFENIKDSYDVSVYDDIYVLRENSEDIVMEDYEDNLTKKKEDNSEGTPAEDKGGIDESVIEGTEEKDDNFKDKCNNDSENTYKDSIKDYNYEEESDSGIESMDEEPENETKAKVGDVMELHDLTRKILEPDKTLNGSKNGNLEEENIFTINP